MPIQHTVVQGDSVASLAAKYGFAPDTIWQHAENAALREKRSNMHALLPGDVVVIPDRTAGTRACTTGRVHRFRRKGVPMQFAMQLVNVGEARAGRPYVLTVDGVEYSGTTDANGGIRVFLPNASRSGTLVVAGGELRLEIDFGHMDPIETLTGVQKRLANMGFACGQPTGEMNAATTVALQLFQLYVGIAPGGTLDEETRAAIAACHEQPGELVARHRKAVEAMLAKLRAGNP